MNSIGDSRSSLRFPEKLLKSILTTEGMWGEICMREN
jgi:hypothetical protein